MASFNGKEDTPRETCERLRILDLSTRGTQKKSKKGQYRQLSRLRPCSLYAFARDSLSHRFKNRSRCRRASRQYTYIIQKDKDDMRINTKSPGLAAMSEPIPGVVSRLSVKWVQPNNKQTS